MLCLCHYLIFSLFLTWRVLNQETSKKLDQYREFLCTLKQENENDIFYYKVKYTIAELTPVLSKFSYSAKLVEATKTEEKK